MHQTAAPLVEIRGLSMSFGGLAAVSNVDLAVERGKITSIIGPNGAGKTTLFNCLSGVLSPDRGAILLDGRGPRRAWSWRTTLACLFAGLVTAALGAGLALNVNGLWRAAVRRPNNFSDQPFTWRASWTGAAKYLRGELAVERAATGRWNVVSADGSTLLATTSDRRQAEEAVERLSSLVTVTRDGQTRRRFACAAALAGLLIGSLGMVSVWKRSRWTPEVVATAGIARTFQNLRLFTRLTVLENVLVALEANRTKASDRFAEGRQLIELVGLTSAAQRTAGELAYGDRRRLEIARALALRPRVLLLDEPAAGMNATETARLKELVRRICDSGVSVVLIDHEMTLVMGISHRVFVLANGRKIAAGTPDEVRTNPAVIAAYLGP